MLLFGSNPRDAAARWVNFLREHRLIPGTSELIMEKSGLDFETSELELGPGELDQPLHADLLRWVNRQSRRPTRARRIASLLGGGAGHTRAPPTIGFLINNPFSDILGPGNERRLATVSGVAQQGGVPLILAPVYDAAYAEASLPFFRTLHLTGGDDLHWRLHSPPGTPQNRYTEFPNGERLALFRDRYQVRMVDRALEFGRSIAAICRGFQTVAIQNALRSVVWDAEDAGLIERADQVRGHEAQIIARAERISRNEVTLPDRPQHASLPPATATGQKRSLGGDTRSPAAALPDRIIDWLAGRLAGKLDTLARYGLRPTQLDLSGHFFQDALEQQITAARHRGEQVVTTPEGKSLKVRFGVPLDVSVEPDSRFAGWMKGLRELSGVEAYHHQGWFPGPGERTTLNGLRIVARFKDGIAAALESTRGQILLTQFHPELDPVLGPLFFRAMVKLGLGIFDPAEADRLDARQRQRRTATRVTKTRARVSTRNSQLTGLRYRGMPVWLFTPARPSAPLRVGHRGATPYPRSTLPAAHHTGRGRVPATGSAGHRRR
jgi:gamma-glutamyl-gamma-aminobutyrate hydrolase PuuD